MSLKLAPPDEVAAELAARARARRLALRLTQAGLAERSGVPLATLRKFERTGRIALTSFVRIALTLGDEAALDGLLRDRAGYSSLSEVMDARPARKRGSRS